MAVKNLVKMSLILLTMYIMAVESRVPIFNRVPNPPAEPVEFNCTDYPGSRPVEIVNSRYWLFDNGTLCCPLSVYNDYQTSYCISESRMRDDCRAIGRGIDLEPCLHCHTCTRLIGETCDGPHAIYGTCDKEKGLECIGKGGNDSGIGVCTTIGGPPLRGVGEECGGRLDSLGFCENGLVCQEVKKGKNKVCVMNEHIRQWNESCGGQYGALGRCDTKLRCTADESDFLMGKNITGTCFRVDQKACFMNCSRKSDNYVCGSDGQWYRHRCYYRKKNCPRADKDKIYEVADESFCGPRPTKPPHMTERHFEPEEESDIPSTEADVSKTNNSAEKGTESSFAEAED